MDGVLAQEGQEIAGAFTLTPTPAASRLSLVQSGFKPDQKQNFAGALRLE